MKKDARLANNSCPLCSQKLDAASTTEDDGTLPEPGDISVCINCGAFLMFRDDMRMDHFPDEKLLEIDDETRLQLIKMRRAVQELKNRDNG